jgi:N-acetylglucosamine malate deacetylase 1
MDQLRDEASYWGKTIGVQYGEPFTSREPIGLRSMGELV